MDPKYDAKNELNELYRWDFQSETDWTREQRRKRWEKCSEKDKNRNRNEGLLIVAAFLSTIMIPICLMSYFSRANFNPQLEPQSISGRDYRGRYIIDKNNDGKVDYIQSRLPHPDDGLDYAVWARSDLGTDDSGIVRWYTLQMPVEMEKTVDKLLDLEHKLQFEIDQRTYEK